MKPRFTLWLSVFALFVTLASCEDHRITAPSGQRFRIKKYEVQQLRDYTGIVFNYGGDGRLASYLTRKSTLNDNGHLISLNYNGQGR
ncbi:hypothetical protein [Spirosoma areae]